MTRTQSIVGPIRPMAQVLNAIREMMVPQLNLVNYEPKAYCGVKKNCVRESDERMDVFPLS
jgi:hypothetical protein